MKKGQDKDKEHESLYSVCERFLLLVLYNEWNTYTYSFGKHRAILFILYLCFPDQGYGGSQTT